MREATLTAVRFPDPFSPAEGGGGPARVLTLVDDPVVARLRDGDATFGWVGDNRLALYLDVQAGRWELWRLEHDNVLRQVKGWAVDLFGAQDIVPAAIVWLVQHDQRRGFDPHLFVVERNEKVRAEKRRADDEAMSEAADRLVHGLKRDGAL